MVEESNFITIKDADGDAVHAHPYAGNKIAIEVETDYATSGKRACYIQAKDARELAAYLLKLADEIEGKA